MKLILILVSIALLTACVHSSETMQGRAQVDYTLNTNGTPHYSVIVQAPTQAKKPGKIQIHGNTLSVETGIDYPAENIAFQHLPYWGVGLIVLGIIILGLRHFLFFMPSWLGAAISGIGLIVTLLPELIERYLGISYAIFSVVVILFLGFWLYRHRLDALTKNQLIQGIEGIKTQAPDVYEKIKPILSQYQDTAVKAEVAKTKAYTL